MHKKKLIKIEDYIDGDLRFKLGETAQEWLERNTQAFLAAVTALAYNPNHSAKVRLDSLKLLLSRALPERSVWETVTRKSELDHMSDSEVAKWLEEKLSELKKGKSPKVK